MTLRHEHVTLVSSLITECRAKPDENEWWRIGSRMHTLTDDYKWLYDYNAAKPELDAMWDAWKKSDPRPKKQMEARP